MNKKILVFGYRGWLGGMLSKQLKDRGHEVVWCHHDINFLQVIDPTIDIVINCAAMTNIDECEKNKYQAFWSNVLGAYNLARACKLSGKKHVFISSACIFESQDVDDWKDEYSKPNPKCFYAETKTMAEKLVREIDQDTLIIRIRLPLI